MKIPRPRLVLPLAVLLFGVLVHLALVQGREPPTRVSRPTLPPVVRVLPVEFQSTRLDVESQGEVTPRTQTTLVAQVAGVVVEVSPALVAGGFFESGELLARIDPTDYRLALKSAEAAVARADVRLAQEEKEAEIARRDWDELGTGEPDPLVLREPQLTEARAVVASERASLERARIDLDRTRIRAPYAGRVREKQADVGQYVTPGTPIARVYSTDAAEVRLAVPADEIGFLDLPLGRASAGRGPGVSLRASFAGRWQEWIGRIVRAEGEIDPATRMLHVVARVDDPYGAAGAVPLAVGLFAEARIEGRVVENVVVLPRSALRGRDAVLVVDDEDRLRHRPVDVLRVDRDVAVITGGLEAGELVCLSPMEVALDGMPVRVQRPGAESSEPIAPPDASAERME